MTEKLLPTTVVGSYVQPEWLVDRANLKGRLPPRVRALEMWRVDPDLLEDAQNDATLLAIRDMERAGVDIITDGEVRRRADAVMTGGYGGLMGFELKGGAAAGKKFIDALELFYHVANIGDARSLAIHPASTTHSQLSEADQLASGVTPGYVRLSIGIENSEDLISDLSSAIAKSQH